MNKYSFVLKKVQHAYVELEFDNETTINQALDEISKFSEEELEFNNPEYQLEVVTKETGKISKIIWKKRSCS